MIEQLYINSIYYIYCVVRVCACIVCVSHLFNIQRKAGLDNVLFRDTLVSKNVEML